MPHCSSALHIIEQTPLQQCTPQLTSATCKTARPQCSNAHHISSKTKHISLQYPTAAVHSTSLNRPHCSSALHIATTTFYGLTPMQQCTPHIMKAAVRCTAPASPSTHKATIFGTCTPPQVQQAYQHHNNTEPEQRPHCSSALHMNQTICRCA